MVKDFRFRFLLALAAVTAAFAVAYLTHQFLPGNDPQNPAGWFAPSSWDQGQYRISALGLTEWNFDNKHFYYPPLFPWLGAPFVRWWPDHTFLVPSLLCLAVHLYGFVRVGERYYGRLLPLAVVALLFAFPKVWIEQFAIPWTSSGTAALSSVLVLLFDRERISRWSVAAFFLAYGAVFATRPLDVVPLLPLAIAMAWRAIIFAPSSVGQKIIVAAMIGACGLAFPALYLGLNWQAHHEGPFGGYIRISREFGLSFSLEHIWSIWMAFSRYFPLLVPALVLCGIAAFRAKPTIRLIAFAVIANTIIYSTYSDLNAHSLIASNMIHYFKWTMPWLLLIAAGQVVELVSPTTALAWRRHSQ